MSRVVFAENGIATPTPELEVHDEWGRFVGRCDFGWEEERTLGEFDGKKKYGRLLLKPDQTPEQALFDEKQREDRLRDLGLAGRQVDLVRPLRARGRAEAVAPRRHLEERGWAWREPERARADGCVARCRRGATGSARGGQAEAPV